MSYQKVALWLNPVGGSLKPSSPATITGFGGDTGAGFGGGGGDRGGGGGVVGGGVSGFPPPSLPRPPPRTVRPDGALVRAANALCPMGEEPYRVSSRTS